MLIATGGTVFGTASVRSRFVLGRRFGLHVIRRSKVVYDTRFVPAATGTSDHVSFFVVWRGTFEFDAPVSTRFEGPVLIYQDEDQFEGARGERPFQLRSFGDPFLAIELRVHRRDAALAPEPKPRAVELDDRGWEAARQLIELDEGDDQAAPSVVRLLQELARQGFLDASVAEHAGEGVPRFVRLWDAVRPMVDQFKTLSTLQEIAAATGLSIRQVARDSRAFFAAFRFFGSGWRGLTVRTRIKMAVLGLSAPGASVGEVARAAGYGSTEAMARAFRDAGLPPPSAVATSLTRIT